ncbi:MAG: winged helix-turn-helix transcriptional regulator [Colwellia sp.]|nr:winged helix-turn-helix transcriptional regulator [Colwellia sp.]
MTIDTNNQSNEILTVSQLMQAPFATGSLIVNFSQNQVTLNGEELILQPKVLELLIILCAANGKTLSKQELIDTLWADTVVGPDSLANTMTRLRKILKDDPKKPVFIKTVQRKGYLWLPSVMNIKKDNKPFNIKRLSLMASALLMGVLLYFLTLPEQEPANFPFPDLSIQKLDEGGYEIQVGIEGKLTKKKKAAMLAELKRITGEEHSDMEFTVDEIVPACINKAIENNEKQHCEKNKNK